MTIRVLELPGDPSARGQAHGRLLADEIDRLIVEQFDNILGAPATHMRGVTGRDELLAWSMQYAEITQSRCPRLWLELEGIAAGSGKEVAEILALNLHLEMIDLANAAAPFALSGQKLTSQGPEAGCTDIAAVRSNGSGCILAQTYDLRSFFETYAFCYRTTANGATLAGLSFAGILAANGMNHRGFGIVINKLYSKDAGIGVPHPFVLRMALEALSTGQALSEILSAPRACGIHYLCGDSGGLLFPLETTRLSWDLLDYGSLYAHTNHFAGPNLRGLECRDFRGYGAHTVLRLQRARQLLNRIGPDAEMQAYESILDDSHDGPIGISCCGAPDMPFGTVGKTLFNTETKQLLIAKGRNALQPINL